MPAAIKQQIEFNGIGQSIESVLKMIVILMMDYKMLSSVKNETVYVIYWHIRSPG